MQIKPIVLLTAGALTLAGCVTKPTNPHYEDSQYPPAGRYVPSQHTCADCGLVIRIDTISSNRSAPTGTGAVLGGIVGAVAGRQISKETGGSKGNKNVAAAAGAVGGALAGNAIQGNVTSDSYNITVQMDDGRTVMINQRDLAGVRENTYVRVVKGKVIIR